MSGVTLDDAPDAIKNVLLFANCANCVTRRQHEGSSMPPFAATLSMSSDCGGSYCYSSTMPRGRDKWERLSTVVFVRYHVRKLPSISAFHRCSDVRDEPSARCRIQTGHPGQWDVPKRGIGGSWHVASVADYPLQY
jgi:hypothetical protein